jgi:hypothetical protein
MRYAMGPPFVLFMPDSTICDGASNVMALIDLSDGMIIGARQSRYTEYFSWIT